METSSHSAIPVKDGINQRKSALRGTLSHRRTLRTSDQLLAAGEALAAWAGALAPPAVTAAYIGIGGEPPTLPLLAALAGRRVLLPVVLPGVGLDWSDAPAGSARAAGPLGLLEPSGERLGPASLSDAGLILVPALAIDRSGGRLGRGGGYYDRALALRSPTARVLGVVFDDELVDELPVEAHDQPVDGALTPGGLVMFGP